MVASPDKDFGWKLPIPPARLDALIAESNLIEGITGVSSRDHDAHVELLSKPRITVSDLQQFVRAVADAPLRNAVGMNVRVGTHIAPVGGAQIEYALTHLCGNINDYETPPAVHVHDAYLWLHPFMDGNGRSARALWMRQMIRLGRTHCLMARGLLHNLYYQHLDANDEAARRWWQAVCPELKGSMR